MKRSKYKNVKIELDGIIFDSMKEANRWQELKILHKCGRIRDLERQRVFILAPAAIIGGRKKPALRYNADFVYVDDLTGKTVVEDVKGVQTDVFRIKRHLMKTVHNVEILLT